MAYFANGSEGMALGDHCDECWVPNGAPCPVLLVQMTYNYDQFKEGNEQLREVMDMLISQEEGCMMKKVIDNGLENPGQTHFNFGGE